jgi:hypothetical protein
MDMKMDVAAPSGPSNRLLSLTRAIEQLLQSHFEDTNEYVIARISGSGDISKNEWTVEARGGPKSDTRCFLEIDNDLRKRNPIPNNISEQRLCCDKPRICNWEN